MNYNIKKFHGFTYYFSGDNTIEHYYSKEDFYYKLRYKRRLEGISFKVFYK
jgi:hypothetical protein